MVGPSSYITDVLLRRGGDTGDAVTQRKDHVRTEQQGDHLPEGREASEEPKPPVTMILHFHPSEL